MELSPRARERLETIGELSPEEKERLKLLEELNPLMADFFKARLSVEGLWEKLRSRPRWLIAEAQKRIIDVIRLEDREEELKRRKEAVLALETLKEESQYTILELTFNSLEGLCRSYRDEKEARFNELKAAVERQLHQAAARMLQGTGGHIEIAGSVEAVVRGSNEWKNFISSHEALYQGRLEMLLLRLKEVVK